MAQYIENVDIIANVKTTADTSGLTGDIKKVLEKPFKLELEADTKGLFNDIRKDIGKIEQVVSKMDFGNLSQNLAQAIQVGAIQGSKSVEETLADLKIQQEKIKKSQIAQAKAIGVQQYDKLVADIQNTFKDQVTLDKQLKKIEGFRERISKWDTYAGIENWQAALLKNVQGSPDLEKLVKNMNKRINLSNENAWEDSKKELDNLKEYYTALDSVHVKPTIDISGLNEALNKLQNFKQLMDQILIDGGNVSFGSAMQGMYNVSDELHRAFTKGSSSDSMYLNVSGINAMKVSLVSLNKAIGEFGDTSKFKNLQEILEHLDSTVEKLAQSFQQLADESLKPSTFYEANLSDLQTTLQAQEEAIAKKNTELRESYKERLEIFEDLASMQEAISPTLIYDDEGSIISRKNSDTYNALKYIGNLTDKQQGSNKHLQYLPKAMSFLEQYLSLGGELADLDKKLNLTEGSPIIKDVRKTLDEREESEQKLTDQRDETLKNIAEQKRFAELARIAESANQPQDSSPLDLQVDEFNASLDSTSSHFERLNTALSSTVDGLEKKDEQEQPKKKKASKYAIDEDTYNNVRETAIDNAKSFIGDREYLDLDVKHLESGVAKVTAKIKEATGEWINFSATVSDTGELLGIRTPTSKTGSKLDVRLAKEKADGTHLSIAEQQQQIEKLRQELNLGDTEKWSISVDTNGFVTIKNNLEQIGNTALHATQKFQNIEDALQNFNQEALQSTLTLSNQLKQTKEAADTTSNSLEDLFSKITSGHFDDGAFGKLSDYNKSQFDMDTHGLLVDHDDIKERLSNLTLGKTSLADFDEAELAEFVRLTNELAQLSGQAKVKLDALADSFGKLKTETQLLKEANKMKSWLEANSNAAEKYGAEIRELIENVKTAFSETAFNKITSQFEQIRGQAIDEGLTGKTSGLTVSEANIKKIQSSLTTKSLDARINKLKELYQSYNMVGLIKGTQLPSTMTDIDDLFNNIGKINIGEASDDELKQLVNTYNQLTDAIKLAENEVKSLQKAHGKIISESEKTIASNQIKKWLQDNSRAAKLYGEELEHLAQQMQEVTTETEYKNIMSQFRSVTSKAAAEGLTGRSLFTEIKDTFSHITQIFGSYSLVDVFQDLGRVGVENIRLVDDALTDLRMSAGLAKNDAQDMMESYAKIGDDMAVLSTDLAKASTDWIKQGESIESATKLAQDSVVLSKLGEVDASEATTYLTSALKGYQLAADEAMDVVDKISTVDIMSATSVGGLAEGMAEVATQSHLVGVEMDDLLGYLAAIGEVTQEDMGSVGGALNTIFSRMGAIKLGRLDDYKNESGEDLSNVETVLRGEGIDLRDATGQFRNFKEVLDEVASKWKSFDNVSQNAIGQAFAGKINARTYSNVWVLA